MDITFDTATGTMSIDATNVHPWGADIRAMLERHGHTINLQGVEMHLTVTADGASVFDMHLPPPGVQYQQTDQDILATGRVLWSQGQAISVSAWCRTNSGHEVTAEAAFTSPALPEPVDTSININSADFDTLRTLHGVDAIRAQAIIDGRPWAAPMDLAQIDGISAGMVEGWMDNPGLVVADNS